MSRPICLIASAIRLLTLLFTDKENQSAFWVKVGGFTNIIIGVFFLILDGSACTYKGSSGICRVITECPSILADVAARRISYGEMVSCGFIGKNPIICCPDNVVDRVGDTSTSTTTEEVFTFE